MSQRRRLAIVLALNLSMIVLLIVVGLSAHSLGVLAAGGDYVADSTAIGLGLLAVTIRDRVGEHSKAPTVVAGVNAAALLAVAAFVLVAGIRRLIEGTPDIQGLPVLIIIAIATAVMLVGVFVLGTGAGREDLHMRSVLLDTISDAVASTAVAVSGLVIYLTGRFFWLDRALSVVIAVVIAFGAGSLLRDVVRDSAAGLRSTSTTPDEQAWSGSAAEFPVRLRERRQPADFLIERGRDIGGVRVLDRGAGLQQGRPDPCSCRGHRPDPVPCRSEQRRLHGRVGLQHEHRQVPVHPASDLLQSRGDSQQLAHVSSARGRELDRPAGVDDGLLMLEP